MSSSKNFDERPSTSTPLKSEYIYSSPLTDDNYPSENIKGTRFLGPKAIKILNNWFQENINYPYPSELATESIAKLAEISVKQVKKWFANKRVRSQMCHKPAKYKKYNKPEVTPFSNPNNTSYSRPIFVKNDQTSNTITHSGSSPLPYQLFNSQIQPSQLNLFRSMSYLNPILLMNLLAASNSIQSKQQSLPDVNTRDYSKETMDIEEEDLYQNSDSTSSNENISSSRSPNGYENSEENDDKIENFSADSNGESYKYDDKTSSEKLDVTTSSMSLSNVHGSELSTSSSYAVVKAPKRNSENINFAVISTFID